MPQIDEILSHVRDLDASDVHLVTGAPVSFHIRSGLVPANDRPQAAPEIELLIYQIPSCGQIKAFASGLNLETAETIHAARQPEPMA